MEVLEEGVVQVGVRVVLVGEGVYQFGGEKGAIKGGVISPRVREGGLLVEFCCGGELYVIGCRENELPPGQQFDGTFER